MQKHDDLRSDKTIIIGFAGPIGAGCSELSKFMADNEQFMQMLKDLGYTNGSSNELKSNILDDEIIGLFQKKREMDQKINRLKSEIKNDLLNTESQHDLIDSQTTAKAIHKKTKKLLEQRNYIYSLQFFFDEDYYNKKLRISCSSIIVFELIRQLPDIINGEVKKNYDEFINLLKNSMTEHGVDQKKFIDVYEKVSSLHEHGSRITDIPPELVPDCFTKIKNVKNDLSKHHMYRASMQDFGDNLRSTGNPYFAPTTEWIKKNNIEFQRNNYVIGRYIDYLVHYYSIAHKTGLFLIDSLRNPMAIKYLRKRYPGFYLISIFSPFDQRVGRVKKVLGDAFDEALFKQQDRRDQGRNYSEIYDGFYKQNVREAVLMSDVSINNEDDFKRNLSDELERHNSKTFLKLMRYICLIVDPGCTKPTTEEMFMNMAYTMALKSNCISRKVGAVIEGAKGYLVGAGWNDVGEGQVSCGLRKIKDLRMSEYAPYVKAIQSKQGNEAQSDAEVLNKLVQYYGNDNCCFCMKDELSKAEIASRVSNAASEGIFEGSNIEALSAKIKVKRLEFCKALHAEENAIIQSAKIGGMGLKNAKIYITTYPCELCAKKIHQAGIAEIIYVEPYPKALSKDLYLSDGARKVDIRQFEGVKARSYMALFQQYIDRKERQRFSLEGFKENIN